MPIFDDIGDLFGKVFGRNGAPPGQRADAVGGALGLGQEWMGELMQSASTKWLPMMLAGIACGTPVRGGGPCGGPAVQQCAICRLPTCLHHALVHSNGDLVCVRCVNAFLQQVRAGFQGAAPPPPRPGAAEEEVGRRPPPRSTGPRAAPAADPPPTEADLRKRHLRTLGLKDPADWEMIKAAYKQKSFKVHPDRAPEHRKAAAAQKLKDINASYAWLRNQMHGSAAA